MKELMRYVEQAVRPVQAGIRRKFRMREELYSHLQGIYDEEFERLEDHDSAVGRAIQRFGSSDELSENLKDSVPWRDAIMRWSVIRWIIDFPATGGRPHSVLSLTFWAWSASCVLLLAVMGFIHLMITRHVERFKFYSFLAIIGIALPVLSGFLFGMAGAFFGVLRHRKSLPRALLYAFVFCCCILVGAFLLSPENELFLSRLVFIVAYAVTGTILTSIASIGIGWQMRKEEANFVRLREWEQLELS
jgi:hypothetical protein